MEVAVNCQEKGPRITREIVRPFQRDRERSDRVGVTFHLGAAVADIISCSRTSNVGRYSQVGLDRILKFLKIPKINEGKLGIDKEGPFGCPFERMCCMKIVSSLLLERLLRNLTLILIYFWEAQSFSCSYMYKRRAQMQD